MNFLCFCWESFMIVLIKLLGIIICVLINGFFIFWIVIGLGKFVGLLIVVVVLFVLLIW